jgi:hypothetical protein
VSWTTQIGGPPTVFWTTSSSLLRGVRRGEPKAVRELQDGYPFSRTQNVWVVNEHRKEMPTNPSPLLPQECNFPPPHISVCPCTSGLFKKCTTFSLTRLLQKMHQHTEVVSRYSYIYPVLRPVSWLGGQNFWLLNTRSWVRFSVLPWDFSLQGMIPIVTMVWVACRT